MESASTCDCATKLLNGKVFSTLLYAETGIDGWLGLSQRESAGFAGCSARARFCKLAATECSLPFASYACKRPPGGPAPGLQLDGTASSAPGPTCARVLLFARRNERASGWSDERQGPQETSCAGPTAPSWATDRRTVCALHRKQQDDLAPIRGPCSYRTERGAESDGDRQRDWYGSLECCGDGCAPCEGRLASTPTQKG